jgi:mRNA-degrading endonuclease RelE of RelBE toxin-antitoxin system
MSYDILMSPEAIDHLREFSAREQSLILDQIEFHLTYDPDAVTRRRKRMRPNPLSPWELRVEQFRVFYDIDEEETQVHIIAVGRKEGNRLCIGRKEVKL